MVHQRDFAQGTRNQRKKEQRAGKFSPRGEEAETFVTRGFAGSEDSNLVAGYEIRKWAPLCDRPALFSHVTSTASAARPKICSRVIMPLTFVHKKKGREKVFLSLSGGPTSCIRSGRRGLAGRGAGPARRGARTDRRLRPTGRGHVGAHEHRAHFPRWGRNKKARNRNRHGGTPLPTGHVVWTRSPRREEASRNIRYNYVLSIHVFVQGVHSLTGKYARLGHTVSLSLFLIAKKSLSRKYYSIVGIRW